MSLVGERREVIFERWKKITESRGEPFPYNNWEEWKADEPKREERKLYWSQKHVWLEDFLFNVPNFFIKPKG